jgi:hypothetical protein
VIKYYDVSGENFATKLRVYELIQVDVGGIPTPPLRHLKRGSLQSINFATPDLFRY